MQINKLGTEILRPQFKFPCPFLKYFLFYYAK